MYSKQVMNCVITCSTPYSSSLSLFLTHTHTHTHPPLCTLYPNTHNVTNSWGQWTQPIGRRPLFSTSKTRCVCSSVPHEQTWTIGTGTSSRTVEELWVESEAPTLVSPALLQEERSTKVCHAMETMAPTCSCADNWYGCVQARCSYTYMCTTPLASLILCDLYIFCAQQSTVVCTDAYTCVVIQCTCTYMYTQSIAYPTLLHHAVSVSSRNLV